MKIRPTFIGIVGASGAGKSTMCKALKTGSKDYEHIKLDNYFKHPRTFPKKHGFANWESPSNLKFQVLLKDLKKLAAGKKVHTMTFPKKAGAKREPVILKPAKYVLIEGFVLFKNKQVRDFLDKKIYLDIKPSLMLKRRGIRFGVDYITEYDTKVAIPEFLRNGVSQKKLADYVVDASQPQSKVIKQVKRIIERN